MMISMGIATLPQKFSTTLGSVVPTAAARAVGIDEAVFFADDIRKIGAGIRADASMRDLDGEVVEERFRLRSGLHLAHFFGEIQDALCHEHGCYRAAPAYLDEVVFQLRHQEVEFVSVYPMARRSGRRCARATGYVERANNGSN